MKIFLSWSTSKGKAIAEVLRRYLPMLATGAKPFLSSHDIEPGSTYGIRLTKELETSNFGIFCLIREALSSPWLNFEAGAISKQRDDSHVVGLLLGGLKIRDIEGPLEQFQHVNFDRDGMLSLVKLLHEKLSTELTEEQIAETFDALWDKLQQQIAEILTSNRGADVSENGVKSDGVLDEIVGTLGRIERTLARQDESRVVNVDTRSQFRFFPLVATSAKAFTRHMFSTSFESDDIANYFEGKDPERISRLKDEIRSWKQHVDPKTILALIQNEDLTITPDGEMLGKGIAWDTLRTARGVATNDPPELNA